MRTTVGLTVNATGSKIFKCNYVLDLIGENRNIQLKVLAILHTPEIIRWLMLCSDNCKPK